MYKLFALAILGLPSTLIAQTISGKVYDAEATVSGAKITNTTEDIMTYTDDKGNFKIKAKVNDSISITSLFHEPKTMVVTPQHFDGIFVIELKKKINELNKVYVNKINEKTFNSVATENTLKTQTKSDMELRPWLYEPPPNLNMDFKKIAGLIAKLFKRRNVSEPAEMMTYGELKRLFETDSFFNTRFLISELKIEKEYHSLFFDFCEAKGIDKTLLLKEHQLLLADTFVQYSRKFLVLIADSKKG